MIIVILFQRKAPTKKYAQQENQHELLTICLDICQILMVIAVAQIFFWNTWFIVSELNGKKIKILQRVENKQRS